MGGKAFAHHSPPLSTPRMPTLLYEILLTHYLSLLQPLYAHVASPIPGPAKPSHGDLDILVTLPHATTTPDVISEVLRPHAVIGTPGSVTTSFAVPYPHAPDSYVQLDLHVCPPETFAWEIFHNAHGDLWNIIGTSLRTVGLTATDSGLYVRIPEIEGLNRKKSMLFLTASPDEVLEFLGLDRERYWRVFDSREEMAEYVAGMRFFDNRVYVREDLKANDRKRLAQREVYRWFVEEWLSGSDEVGCAGKDGREEVLEEVLSRWGKRDEYRRVLAEWKQERGELLGKQEVNESRRRGVKDEVAYADAWIGASK